MVIAIRKEPDGSIYIDKTVLKRFDEKTLKQEPYNFSIIEIEDIFQDCKSSDFNENFTFNFVKYNNRKLNEENQNRLFELKKWFDVEYARQEQKFRRLHTMKKLCDDGSSPLERLYDLYDEAEEKRKEIQRLEQGGDSNGTLHDYTL